MTAQNKIETNRTNALKSTGPRTAKGKEIVAANATKHGLMSRRAVIEGESQAEYDAFCAATFDDRSPVGMMEHELTDIIASSFWRLRRIKRIEVELLDSFTDTPPSQGREDKLPFTFILTKTYTGLPPEENDQQPTFDESPTENTHAEHAAPIDNPPVPPAGTQDPSPIANGQELKANGQQPTANSQPPIATDCQSPKANRHISLGHAFVTDTAAGNALTKLQRYEAHIYRTLYKAIDELRRFQRERRSQIDIDQF